MKICENIEEKVFKIEEKEKPQNGIKFCPHCGQKITSGGE